MNPESIPYFGELLSFLTALVWASSVILFKKSGETVSPMALNLVKNGFAATLMVPTLLILGVPLLPDLPLKTYGLALLGGFLSIGLADTTFFRSLNLLGAGRHAVVDTLYSPSVILFAFVFLGERLELGQWLGVAAVVGAVLMATWEPGRVPLERRRMLEGTVWGVVSVLLMGAGLAVIKPLLDTENLFWVTLWRMIGGLGAMVIILPLHPRRKRVLASLKRQQSWGWLLAASFVGAYLVTMIWLGGMKYTSLSIASAINQTSTVLTFLLAAVLLKESITPRKTLAIMMAFGGAVAVTVFG